MRRYSPATSVISLWAAITPGPLRHVTGFPGLRLLRVLRPIPSVSAGNKPSRRPTFAGRCGNRRGWFPRSVSNRSTGSVSSYAPATSPRPAPQTFTVASRSATSTNRRVPHTSSCVGARCCAALIRQVRAAGYLRSVRTLVPRVHLSVLLAGPGPSGSTSPFRRCQGCCPPSPLFQGSGCPQLQRARCDEHEAVPFTTARLVSASWRLMSVTHKGLGATALNRRSTRSAGRTVPVSELVVRCFRPLTAPWSPMPVIRRSTVHRGTAVPWRWS